MNKGNSMSVLEYLNNLLYYQMLRKPVYLLPEERIDIRIKNFALKLLNCEQIKTINSCVWREFGNKLYHGTLPSCPKKLYHKDNSMIFKYSNSDVLEFLNYLRQINYNTDNFKTFFRIPHIYNMFVNLYYSDIFFYEFVNIKGMPINRKNVIRILDILGIFKEYKDECCLLLDSALMFYGIKDEVGFLDIAVTPKLFSKLDLKFKIHEFSDGKYGIGNIIEITVIDKEKFSANKKDIFLLEKVEDILSIRENELQQCKDNSKIKRLTVEVKKINEYLEK